MHRIVNEVIINGVKYVPEREVRLTNERAIKLALLTKFWGDCSNLTDEELNEHWEGVFVLVTDYVEYRDEKTYFTIDSLITEISNYSKLKIDEKELAEAYRKQSLDNNAEKS